MRFNINILFGVLFSLVVFLIFGTAIFADNHTMASISTILAMIFGGLLLSILVKAKDPVKSGGVVDRKKELIQDVAHDIIFSLQSLDVRLDKALHSVQKLLKSKGVYVGVYEKNQIHILQQKHVVDGHKIDTFMNLQTHSNPIEKAILDFYKEKEKIKEDVLYIKDEKFKVYIYPLMTKNSLDSFGFFMSIYENSTKVDKETVDKMRYLAETIAFSVNIVYKKDTLMQTNLDYYKKYNEVDENLNIFNENKIQKTISNEFERYKRYLTPLSIILFEIDDIRNISNILTKDELLVLKKEFVELVRTHIRTTDIFGVWDGDVFIIIAQNVDYQGAKVVVAKLQSIINKRKFHRINFLSCSYGITAFSQKDTLKVFQKRAYDSLQKAKNKGGDGVEIQLLV